MDFLDHTPLKSGSKPLLREPSGAKRIAELEARVAGLEADCARIAGERALLQVAAEQVIQNCQRGSETMGMSAAGIQSCVASLKKALK